MGFAGQQVTRHAAGEQTVLNGTVLECAGIVRFGNDLPRRSQSQLFYDSCQRVPSAELPMSREGCVGRVEHEVQYYAPFYDNVCLLVGLF